MTDHITILRGVAGSTAHGLAREGSDKDYLGAYSYPTNAFWSLRKPQETITGHEPVDSTMHELEKFLSLASKSNPTVLELLWLPEYVHMEPVWGERLVSIRQALLSEKYVHDAYLGYATAQFRKLQSRDFQSFSASTAQRSYKHARHMFRLLEQGADLYATGDFNIQVRDPEWYFSLEFMSLEEINDLFTSRYESFLDRTSVLPKEPDWAVIDQYLADYREAHVLRTPTPMHEIDVPTERRLRTYDPETSLEAAASLMTEQTQRLYKLIHNTLIRRDGCTDEELVEFLDPYYSGEVFSPSGIRSRRKELVDAGWVVKTEARRDTRAGNSSIVWRAIEPVKA